MAYTIGEVSKMLELPIPTLRYYDKEGLLPLMERTPGGFRIFLDIDIQWLKTIECLKRTGMQLKDIKQYFEWCAEGDSTIGQRYEMLLERKAETEKQIALLNDSLKLVEYKCEYYRIAKEAGTTDLPQLKILSSENTKSFDKLYNDVVN